MVSPQPCILSPDTVAMTATAVSPSSLETASSVSATNAPSAATVDSSSFEHRVLSSFCERLGSCTMHEPEGSQNATRLDATLLMSLSDHSTQNSTRGSVSSSGSHGVSKRLDSSPRNGSFSSVSSADSNHSSMISRVSICSHNSHSPETIIDLDDGSLSFSCPSLSLAHTTRSSPPHTQAQCLSRPLTVTHVDAIRLSADAMARNLSDTVQASMEERLQRWCQSLTTTKTEGTTKSTTSSSPSESYTKVLQALEQAIQDESIAVHGIRTSFRVLPTLVEKRGSGAINPMTNAGTSPGPSDSNAPLTSTTTSPILDSSTSSSSSAGSLDSQPCGIGSTTNTYTVHHHLDFGCDVYVATLDQFSEVELQVPGKVRGTFRRDTTGANAAHLVDVSIHLETHVLVPMIHKACGIMARAALEPIVKAAASVPSTPLPTTTEATPIKTMTESCHASRSDTALTPSNDAATAFVTPRQVSHGASDLSACLLPIPDDFTSTQSNFRGIAPRRLISPQPTTANNSRVTTPPPPPTNPKRRRTSSYTPVQRRLPLISPLAGDGHFHEVPENGPSLPLLVEAACRARRVD